MDLYSVMFTFIVHSVFRSHNLHSSLLIMCLCLTDLYPLMSTCIHSFITLYSCLTDLYIMVFTYSFIHHSVLMSHGPIPCDVYMHSFFYHSVLMSHGPIPCDVYIHSFIHYSVLMSHGPISTVSHDSTHNVVFSINKRKIVCLNLKETKIQAQIYFLRHKARLTPNFKLNLSRFQCISCTKSISSKKQS